VTTRVNYKFYEDKLIKELQQYVDKTYDQHYATDKYQATDVIIDSGHGTGFCLGNVIKYAKRYGNKGSACDARKDLMKILHYTLIQLYIHDEENKTEDRNPAYGPYPEYNNNYRQDRLNNVTPEQWDAIKMGKGVSLSG